MLSYIAANLKKIRILLLIVAAAGGLAAALKSSPAPDYQEEEMQPSAPSLSSAMVSIFAEGTAGSGIIWELTPEQVIIVSNRHVLTQAGEAAVTFYDGTTMQAQLCGYSTQYDIAFLQVAQQEMPKALQETLTQALYPLELYWQERAQAGVSIRQLGGDGQVYEGSITNIEYIPKFDTDMLVTSCYAKAGMSGGGVYDGEGWLLGMITGGEAAGTGSKEAWITYSLPSYLIAQEWQALTF